VCGIAGVVGSADQIIDTAEVHRMCETIIHRGPDEEGIYAKGSVGLGMRRLSIIDLSGGRQPIHNEDKSLWIVFNGEIYNFPELRLELEARGHTFYTHSDTEVIVHLYEEMGVDCVKKLRGMFAIALYDERKQSLFLARDRLGKKPLYYARHNGCLYFGSEVKAILAVAPELAEVNPEGILQFFYFGYIPDPHSAFRKIRKLPPGHLAEYRHGEIKEVQYWDVPAYGAHDPGSDEDCLNEMEQGLAEAVRIRLISDVPLGALLSGGVDSSIVVALMARSSSDPVKTFSIGFSKADFNEAEYARAIAERFGTDHHELVIDPNISETLNQLTRMMEEPFGDSSMIPTYYVSRLARQHVTVALSGDGGDELFAGYDRYIVNYERRRYDVVPAWLGALYRDHMYRRLPSSVKAKRLSWNLTLSSRDRYLDSISFLPALHRERALFSDDFVSGALQWGNPFRQFQNYHDQAPATDPLSRLMYLDMKTYLTADILTKVDRMSMATSLEMRCPILDHVFVEWAVGLPVKYKFRNDTRKFMLKKLAERLGIPRALLERPKQGFSMPLVHWMRDELKDGLLQLLLEPRTLQRGYFDPRSIRVVMDEHFRGRRNHAGVLWMLLILELWHRNFLEADRMLGDPIAATCSGRLPGTSQTAQLADEQGGCGG
jgi:asparagine synthase (glutamine-hydrolysing)